MLFELAGDIGEVTDIPAASLDFEGTLSGTDLRSSML